MARGRTVLAAGTVVWQRHQGHTHLLLIHRPKYDDWTFPKGKLDSGELLPGAAVRETYEETGVRVRLGMPLSIQKYRSRGESHVTKQVRYWLARPVGDHDITAYAPNAEVDEVRWVRLRDVPTLLTYERDQDLIAQLRSLQRKTRTLLVIRHAKALSRKQWSGPDTERPLTPEGTQQAVRLADTLAAYGVGKIVSSDAQRCTATALPYAERIGTGVTLEPRLREEGARREPARDATYALLGRRRPVGVVTHRPVLPYVTDTLGLTTDPLAPADVLVVHHRDGEILATERYAH